MFQKYFFEQNPHLVFADLSYHAFALVTVEHNSALVQSIGVSSTRREFAQEKLLFSKRVSREELGKDNYL
jgi:hypothetical protein